MRTPIVAVPGASGFIGAQVIRELADGDFRVRAGARPGSVRWHAEDVECQWSEFDIDDRQSLRSLFRGATGVIHCAGYHPRRALRPRRAKQKGVQQLRNVLDACRAEDVKRVVYLSCAATAVGDGDASPVDETSRYVPGTSDNAFLEAKAAMEAEAYRYVASGMDIVIAAPTMVFGPGDIDLSTAPLIRAAIDGKLPALPTDTAVNIVDVRDVARGIVAALRKGRRGRRYFLAGHNVDIESLFEALLDAAGRRRPKTTVPLSTLRSLVDFGERLVDRVAGEDAPELSVLVDRSTTPAPLSNERATGELGVQFRSVDTTIADTLAWMERVGYLSWSTPRTSAGLLRL